jgi:hypothetical protein
MSERKVVSCAELIGKSKFENYSEVILVGCLAKEVYRCGYILDMSMMKLNRGIIGKTQRLFIEWLEYKGMLITGIVRSEGWKPDGNEPYVFDVTVADEYLQNLFEDCGDKWRWSDSWSRRQNYGKWENQMYTTFALDSLLLHLIAIFVFGMIQGTVKDMPIEILIDGVFASSTDYYLDIHALRKSLPWFNRKINLVVSSAIDSRNDVEFDYFVKSGIVGGRRRPWTVSDKIKLLKMYGIQEGSIVVVYSRKGIKDCNLVGQLLPNVKLCRVDRINETGIDVTVFPLYKTKQEVIEDYQAIPEDVKYMFRDMLDFEIKAVSQHIDFYSLGIGNYLFDESRFILPLDKTGRETCVKRFTICGRYFSEEILLAERV